MATRAKRAIDPKKVTDLDTWLKNYKSGYGNLVQRGSDYLVLDPTQFKTDYAAALASPAKVIASTKAIDAQQILKTSSGFPQLRATAESTMKSLSEKQQKQVQSANDAVNTAENTLLSAALTWQTAPKDESAASTRSELALAVVKANIEMSNAESSRIKAMYPIRYIKAEPNLLRKDLDYATHDDRKLTNELYRIVLEPTQRSDRIVPMVTEAGKV